MSASTAELSAAIDPLRVGLQADGADLVVESVVGSRAVVRLVITDQSCAECLVPYDLLRFMVSGAIAQKFPEIADVDMVDPRRVSD